MLTYLGDKNFSLEDFGAYLQVIEVKKKLIGPDYDVCVSDGELSLWATYEPCSLDLRPVPKLFSVLRVFSTSGHPLTGDLTLVR